MNIHEAAVEILHKPVLENLQYGLCKALKDAGAVMAYEKMKPLMGEWSRLPEYRAWTDQRLNIVILLSITTPEDFI